MKYLFAALLAAMCFASWPPNALAQNPQPYRVLVAFTQAVQNAEPDVSHLVDDAIAAANDSYDSSQIGNIAAEVVCVVLVDYQEVCGSLEIDLQRFQQNAPADNFMNEIHQLRIDYAADCCVLLVHCTGTGNAGLAYRYTANNMSFSVSRANRAASYFTLAHEIGHNFGADHDRVGGISSNQHFPWGHGFRNSTDAWRTIMAVFRTGSNAVRIPYWSNPNVNRSNEAVGSAAHEDNARVLRGRIDGTEDPDTVGAFMNNQTTPATIQIATHTIRNHERIRAIASSRVELRPGFQLNSGGRFSAVAGGAVLGKRRARGSIPAQPPPVPDNVTMPLPEKLDFSAQLIGNALDMHLRLPGECKVGIALYDAKGTLAAHLSLGHKSAGIWREKATVPRQCAGKIHFAVLRAGNQRLKKTIASLR